MPSIRYGKHTVTVTPRIEAESDRGLIVYKDGQPVTYHANVQPVSTAERAELGVTTRTVYRIKYFPQAHGGKPWVGGSYSRIRWDGKDYEQLGDALKSSMSPRTGHIKVLMQARAPEAR